MLRYNFFVFRRESGVEGVVYKFFREGVYLNFKKRIWSIYIFCEKEGWRIVNVLRLSGFESVDRAK